MRDLITAMYKAEQLPVRVRLYAASKAAEFENQNGRNIDEIREEIRQEFMSGDRDETLDKLMDQIRRNRAAIIAYRDQQLRGWLAAGELTDRGAVSR
jgi:hypothetical protein